MVSFKKFITEWSDTPDSIASYLKKRGYKKLGKGVDQTAFLEPGTDQVLKIFGSDESGHNNGHDMFAYWASYCKKHSNNPFLPKFSGWTKFNYDKDGKDYLQIRMEKLQKLPEELSNALGSISDAMEQNTTDKVKKVIFKNLGTHTKKFNLIDEDEDIEINNFDEINKLAILLGEKNFNLLLDTISNLEKMASSRGYKFDLHGDNFMHRNDGTPIIVDPWVAFNFN